MEIEPLIYLDQKQMYTKYQLLLNLLLKEEKAIVSDVHGTTRDVIEDTVTMNGMQFRFIDTAGLRETTDKVEKIGIERSYREIEKAVVVLWVVDASQSVRHSDELAEKIKQHLSDQKLLIVFNKTDLIDEEKRREISEYYKQYSENQIFISAKNAENTDEVESVLVQSAQIPMVRDGDVMVTNIRHYEALKNAYSAIRRVQQGLEDNISGDFLSQDIRECIYHLGEITGEITTDEVLGNIFSKFCIGK